jgi:hypothetical protein
MGQRVFVKVNAFVNDLHIIRYFSFNKTFPALERAFVTGLEAANSLLKVTTNSHSMHEVIPVREDEKQFQMGVKINNEVMKFIPRFWVR